MAGGEIPLGIFAEHETGDTGLIDVVERLVTHRLIDGLGLTDAGDVSPDPSAE